SMALPPYADTFARAGLAVLVYDHRNLGESDGPTPGEINPWEQSRDSQAALTWLGDQPEVDGGRLGLWGSSFSGGEALVVAAVDDRVRAVVANVPWAGLPGVEGGDDEERFRVLRAEFDPATAKLSGPGGTVLGPLAVVPDGESELPPFLDHNESIDWYLREGAASGTWRNEVTLRNAFGSEPSFDPGLGAAQLGDTPLLMVITTDDQVAPTEIARAAYARVTGPKRMVEIDGHHFVPYAGPALRVAAEAARDHFLEHL
ncbi:MAG: alpha/beta hydrolase, partial [Acidimicrobiales bacterium]